jgi:hypothetical protein
MQPTVEVADLCRREGINPAPYDGWKKQLLASAGRIFEAQDVAAMPRKNAARHRYNGLRTSSPRSPPRTWS